MARPLPGHRVIRPHLAVYGLVALVAAIANAGSVGATLYYVEWQAVVGVVSVTAGVTTWSGTRMASVLTLCAALILAVGNGYRLLVIGIHPFHVAAIAGAMVLPYLALGAGAHR